MRCYLLGRGVRLVHPPNPAVLIERSFGLTNRTQAASLEIRSSLAS